MHESPLRLIPTACLAAVIFSGCGGSVVERTPPAPDAGRRGTGGTVVGGDDLAGPGGTVGVGGSGAAGGFDFGGAAGAAGFFGGTGGADVGAGGEPTVTEPPKCVLGQSIACACADGHQGAQVCGLDGTYAPCVCRTSLDGGSWEQQQLAKLRKGVLGTWVGTQTNPWQAACSTTMTFDAGGHYTAHSTGEACIVFYYGTNDDSPEKIYDLNDIQADGKGSGSLAIYFRPGDTNLGVLDHIVLSDDENQLSFECRKDGYGPLVFSLTRQSN
jgi:hypothetical protein